MAHMNNEENRNWWMMNIQLSGKIGYFGVNRRVPGYLKTPFVATARKRKAQLT